MSDVTVIRQPVTNVTVTESDLTQAIGDARYIKLTQKAAANGVATLDGNTTVPDAQIPAAIARDAEVTTAVAGEATARATAVTGEATARAAADSAHAASATAHLGTYVPIALPGELNFGLVNGVDRTGVSDMTALLATAIATGRPIYVPEGDYLINGSATPLGQAPRIRGAGAGKTRFIQGTSYPVFDLAGAVGSTVALTANAAAGALALTANAGLIASAGIVAGDYLILRSNLAWPNTDKDATYGEMVRVASVSGTTINLYAPIEDAYATADTAVVEKLTQRLGIELADFTVENLAPNTKTYAPAIQIRYARNVRIQNLTAKKIDGQAIIIEATTDWVVDGCRFYDLADDPGVNQRYGYGVDARECSNDGRVVNCYMRGGRHLFTADSYGVSPTIPRGIPRHILVSNCEATETTNAAFDTHIESEHITFVGCRAHGVRGPGVQVRGRRVSVRNMDINGTLGPGVWVRDLSTVETDISNVRTRNNRDGTTSDGLARDGQGLRIEGSAGRVKASGIYVENVDQDGVFIGGNGSAIHTLDDIFIRSAGQSSNPFGLRFQSNTQDHRIGRLVIEFVTNGIYAVGTLTNVSFDWANTVFSNVATPLTGVTKPAVTGTRNGNPAIASLLTQLAAEGLITDSSTSGTLAVTGTRNGNPAVASLLTQLATQGLITDGTTVGTLAVTGTRRGTALASLLSQLAAEGIITDSSSAGLAYWPLLSGRNRFDAAGAQTAGLHEGGAASPTGAFGSLGVYYLDPADYPSEAKFRVKCSILTNDVAPTSTFTAGLYPITTPGGAAATVTGPFGTVVSGSTAVIAAPALDTKNQAVSTDFTPPAAGWYSLGIVIAGNMVANSAAGVRATLDVKF